MVQMCNIISEYPKYKTLFAKNILHIIEHVCQFLYANMGKTGWEQNANGEDFIYYYNNFIIIAL